MMTGRGDGGASCNAANGGGTGVLSARTTPTSRAGNTMALRSLTTVPLFQHHQLAALIEPADHVGDRLPRLLDAGLLHIAHQVDLVAQRVLGALGKVGKDLVL